jgi:CRP/FNR family transcriptional regulator, cyclic AMP receptor protein
MAETSVENPADGSFLTRLGPEARAVLTTLGRPRTYRHGELLFLEGEHSDTSYLVVGGAARVYRTTSQGKEVTLSVRGPGDLIGEMAALDPGNRRSATVVALDTLRCRAITATDLKDFLESHPQAAVALLRLVIGRLREADRRRTEFGSYDATRRLARVLVEVANDAVRRLGAPIGRPLPEVAIGLSLTQRELAGLIGASRESVARALAELRRRRLVTTSRREITICDPVALRNYAT